MTQENKELLIKDLCARLDTNLVCSIYRIDDYGVGYRDEILSGYCKDDIWDEFFFGDDCGIGIDNVSKIKPYLFPLSSMTEEQKNDCPIGETNLNIIISNLGCYGIIEIPWRLSFLFVDWCNKNHFDYRGLIPMGLAIDATGKGIY